MARRQNEGDVLSALCGLAEKSRVAFLLYRKPGEDGCTERHVEPYRLQESGGNLMVQTWQLKPAIGDRTKWRNFRIDRIQSVADGGSTFSPRCPVTIHLGEVNAFEWGHDPVQTLGPAVEYQQCIEDAMLDNRVTPSEIAQAKTIGIKLSLAQLRGVHGQVYCNILQEVLRDGEISQQENEYLAGVRMVLAKLGWEP